MATINTGVWAVVPAAGIGSRMESPLPKQYLPLLNSTVLDITLGKLLSIASISAVVVSLNKRDRWWRDSRFARHPRVLTCHGGTARADSVFNALLAIPSLAGSALPLPHWVLVHDAARPCVELARIEALLKHCTSTNIGGILAAPAADTLKKIDGQGRIVATLDRQSIWHAHTPQCFPYRQLHAALEHCSLHQLTVTDEASAVERQGGEVAVVNDRRDNIKITLPEDLLWAQTILQQQQFDVEKLCV